MLYGEPRNFSSSEERFFASVKYFIEIAWPSRVMCMEDVEGRGGKGRGKGGGGVCMEDVEGRGGKGRGKGGRGGEGGVRSGGIPSFQLSSEICFGT